MTNKDKERPRSKNVYYIVRMRIFMKGQKRPFSGCLESFVKKV